AAYILRKKTDLPVFAVFCCLGFLMFSFSYSWFPENHMKNYRHMDEVKAFEALVVTLPEESEERTYFTAEVKKLYAKKGEISGIRGKIRVTVEKALGSRIRYGDTLRINAAPARPAPPKNPGEFDYASYLRKDRIFYTAYAKGAAVEKTAEAGGNPLYAFSYGVRQRLVGIIYKSLPLEQARVLDGIMLGNQRAIPPGLYEKFKSTGTVHILAVSGMNVGLIAFFVFLLLKLMGAGRKAAAALTMGFITVFAVVTGAGASIVRATIMGYAVLMCVLMEHDADVTNSVFAAALFILLVKPCQILDIGFQLSFLATFGIVYFSEEAKKLESVMPAWLGQTVFATVSAQVFIFPVMANTFHQVSIISVIANLFIVPLSSLISMAGFCMWLFGTVSADAAAVMGAGIWALIKAVNLVAELFAAVPYASVSIKSLPAVFISFYTLFFLAAARRDIDIMAGRISLKTLLGAGLCVFLAFHLLSPQKGPSVTALATKDLHAVFYVTPDNKKVLFLGCDDAEKSSSARNIVAPFLRNAGVNNIDRLILYSVKNQENVEAIRSNFRVKRVISDSSYQRAGFYEKIGRHTSLHMNSYMAELDSGGKTFVFTKLLAGGALRKRGAVIYACFFSETGIVASADGNKCVINGKGESRFKKRKISLPPGVWDVGEKGAYRDRYCQVLCVIKLPHKRGSL
ncbi:MAG TPA: ComEC/Rec2 family competence protein, partial [Candidatus Goldiibacteriota bacterium]|nr:ComEC/Rec2 family competence protein [Candidatus Goldiibacteriota bacterium]